MESYLSDLVIDPAVGGVAAYIIEKYFIKNSNTVAMNTGVSYAVISAALNTAASGIIGSFMGMTGLGYDLAKALVVTAIMWLVARYYYKYPNSYAVSMALISGLVSFGTPIMMEYINF